MTPRTRLLTISTLLFATTAMPCCIVWNDERTAMLNERAVVVWDEKNRTQHFIRSTAFFGGSSVGFVFPAPSLPTLGLADHKVFPFLRDQHEGSRYEEYLRIRNLPEYRATLTLGSASSAVISVQQIGRYEATILRSKDAGSINAWMQSNGFNNRQEAQDWTAHYAKKGWYLVAFRFNGKDKTVTSEALRISFRTKQPHYPYHMPDDIEFWSGRKLLLYTLSSAPMKWVCEDGRPSTMKPSGRMTEISDEDRPKLAKMLDISELPVGAVSKEEEPAGLGDLTQNIVAIKDSRPQRAMTRKESDRVLRLRNLTNEVTVRRRGGEEWLWGLFAASSLAMLGYRKARTHLN